MAEDLSQRVIDELASRNVQLYKPIDASNHSDLVAKTKEGNYLELQILIGDQTTRSFKIPNLRPQSSSILIYIDRSDHGEPGYWILPFPVIDRFATGHLSMGDGVMNLDMPEDEPLSAALSVYRNRWDLIAKFKQYESVIKDPTALKVRIALDS